MFGVWLIQAMVVIAIAIFVLKNIDIFTIAIVFIAAIALFAMGSPE